MERTRLGPAQPDPNAKGADFCGRIDCKASSVTSAAICADLVSAMSGVRIARRWQCGSALLPNTFAITSELLRPSELDPGLKRRSQKRPNHSRDGATGANRRRRERRILLALQHLRRCSGGLCQKSYRYAPAASVPIVPIVSRLAANT